MKQLVTQFLEAEVSLLALQMLGEELSVGVGPFNGSVLDASFEAFIQVAQVRLCTPLRTEIAADCRHVHRLSGSRIVDPKAVDQEGYWRPGSEMHEIKFSLPPAATYDRWPNLALHGVLVSW